MKLTIHLDTIIARVQETRTRERTLRSAGVAVLRDWKRTMRTDRPCPPKPTTATPGELLFQFTRGNQTIRCELRDHGPVFGVEAQFLHDGFPLQCRTFNPRLNPDRTPREMAIAWAEEERKALEAIDGAP